MRVIMAEVNGICSLLGKREKGIKISNCKAEGNKPLDRNMCYDVRVL
jgi:hypothetical protein